MSDDEQKLARLQALFTSLLKQRLSESLGEVESALSRWRGGEVGPFEAHAELLRHVARAERLASAIARTNVDDAGPVLKLAYDAGLVETDEFVELVGVQPDQISATRDIDDVDVTELPPKRDFVENLLEEGPVLVHLDPRRDGVSVPEHLRGDPRLVLRFGYGLAPAIVDLAVSEEGLSGTLTFAGLPHHCVLPWSAVYAAVSEASQQAMVWPDDVPPEVLDQMTRNAEKATSQSAAEPAVPEPREEQPTQKKPRRAGHLKLVE